MTERTRDPIEPLADHFVAYLFDRYKGTRHVRRVASWVGFILKAVEKAADGPIRQNRERQIVFRYSGRKFKARYNHRAGMRGGIDIVEVVPGQGAPDGEIVLRITNLTEAENAYLNLDRALHGFVRDSK